MISTKIVQDNITLIFNNFKTLNCGCHETHQMYWNHNVGSFPSWTAATGSDSVTFNTKLSKDDVINGITLCENMFNFFQNMPVGQSEYIKTVRLINNGNSSRLDVMDEVVEAIGDRLKAVAEIAFANYSLANFTMKYYFSNEVNLILAAISDGLIVPGTEITKLEFTAAITFVEQWQKFCTNQAVTQGDYFSTLAKWGLN